MCCWFLALLDNVPCNLIPFLQASQDLSKKMAGLDVAKNGAAPRAVLASMR